MSAFSHEKLVDLTEQLRALLASVPTHEVVMRAFWAIQKGPNAASATGLLAPYKQSFFLLGLMLTTPAPENPRSFDDESWERARHLVFEIYNLYADIFWPSVDEEPSVNEEWIRQRSVAMPTFFQYWTGGKNVSTEQMAERASLLLEPFDKEVSGIVGVSASDVLRIQKWISKEIQKNLDSFNSACRSVADVYKRFVEEKWSWERFDAELAGSQTGPVLLSSELLSVELSELERHFGAEQARAFWKLFVSERRATADFLYITARNPAEESPLFLVAPGKALIPVGNQLAMAVLSRLGEALQSDKAIARRFIAHRDKVLESSVERLFRGFLGAEARVYASACEQIKGQYEHDLVVVAGRRVFIVEAKASPPVEPFRDPEKAFTRIRQAFRSDKGLQKAFEQANRLRRRLVTGEKVELYDVQGRPLVSLDGGAIERVCCVCVTADDFGIVATDLSMLLEKSVEDPYPWAVNVFDLEAFLKALRKKCWGEAELADYLTQRQFLHGKVFTQDELEIAGVFVLHGSLSGITPESGSRLYLSHELADVFDDLYVEEQGGPAAVMTARSKLAITTLDSPPTNTSRRAAENRVSKVVLGRAVDAIFPGSHGKIGRNEQCPCGSGRKYKRCCISSA